MKRNKLALAALAGAALAPSAPASAGTLELAPASDWELRTYDDKCRIARDFGAGEDAVTLWIDKGGPGPSVNLTFIGRPMRDPYGPTVRFAFAEAGKAERNYVKVTSSAGRPVLVLFGVRPMDAVPELPVVDLIEPDASLADEEVDLAAASASDTGVSEKLVAERLSGIESLHMEGAIIEPVTLEFDGFGKAMADLATCTADLTDRLEGQGSDGWTPPEPDGQEAWVREIIEDYPAHLLRKEEEGSVNVRLTVGKTGRVSFCEVTDFSGPASFNETACLNLIKHARFKPAKDDEGNPVPAFWETRVTYAIR
ncbi:energy transducer TonB [Erythrobacter sp.]|uniref:energy transducer TonB n=1 Tax=Erythrobacter sp. TaxID=1042 RepID=UPI001425C700|nr:energy transducer TonB [Erythrobacter sp.]QIQ87570.1 MAG: energy transducer TonB [Erythrobacter sp.]